MNDVTVQIPGFPGVFNRDRLETAMLLRMDGRDAVMEMVCVYGYTPPEARRYALAARHCIERNIEP